jgi:hypothetical protein
MKPPVVLLSTVVLLLMACVLAYAHAHGVKSLPWDAVRRSAGGRDALARTTVTDVLEMLLQDMRYWMRLLPNARPTQQL